MSEKIYIVTLYKHEDLEEFYAEMKEKGFRLNMKRPVSRNTHYWMTDEQAQELKKDPRVWDVDLRPEDRGIFPESFATIQDNLTPFQMNGTFWKGDTQGSPTVSSNDRQWGQIHCGGTTAQRGKNQFGLINSGGSYEQVTDTVNIFNDGKHVDVVICDDPVSSDCSEWFSPTTGLSRFVEYDWYSELNLSLIHI